ncbi:glycoside hydrolase family 32 protein [Sphingobacterium sp. BIGb0165]|uniref:glycoside hydrolase family 32 protein n=1 Tax=Sphingobacterium sp. BIGb0165 TaxID=2940615 RepID=UPI002168C7CB|nr:glycoside hydrolase family 32 protein [Sphingobacterium sp. BIGb0165]MCS4229024.1 fructan beta-fructosidase [Sphingobacterium sp. BIGb0165]
MNRIKKYGTLMLFTSLLSSAFAQVGQRDMNEPVGKYRPIYHFTPKQGWMNDPNGMVYLNGNYHLFFQHNPEKSVWGPMHWGHAISRDLIHWDEQKIALYPDSLGTIFSGSAVIDKNNTAGFGKGAMVAIFTHHNHQEEDRKTGLHQNQSLAYSLDQGATWTKYKGNPVLPNPGIWDFRDPKVMWFEKTKSWIMTLATKDCITFYSSKDLKEWKKESEFGKEVGAHGGVWECPDLIPMKYNGETKWVLLVSINPGGPNGGSVTQYFVGDFDGHQFQPVDTSVKWLDWGPDNYAGVTWSNLGERHLMIGWMSNWQYANVVPTTRWRSSSTIPRELTLQKVDQKYYVSSTAAPEVAKAFQSVKKYQANQSKELTVQEQLPQAFRLEINKLKVQNFKLILSNAVGNELVVGYDKGQDAYYIDRSKSGEIAFNADFPKRSIAGRLSNSETLSLSLYIDVSSVELFADNGLTAMTSLFFPEEPMTRIRIVGDNNLIFRDVNIATFRDK